MVIRYIRLIMLATIALAPGCKKEEPAKTVSFTPSGRPMLITQLSQTIARVHWLGQEQLAPDTNAAPWIDLGNLPESVKLHTQTLDKLSLAPWRLLHVAADTNAAARLRPLLDDLLHKECFLEARETISQSGELALAIRLDDARAALWQTNLAAVLESLTGIRPASPPGQRQAWSLKKHHQPNLLELVRTNGWTIVGAAQDQNGLVDNMITGILQNGVPFEAAASGNWLEAELDLQRVARVFPFHWNLPADWPAISLAITGNGQFVQTRGALNFPRPLPLDLEPWNVPTNLIDGALSSFTAIRGFRPWLAPLPAWTNLQIGLPPSQLFAWSLQAQPMLTYFAAPMPDASNVVNQLSSLVLEKGTTWFDSHEATGFQRSETFNGIRWTGLPYLWPFLQSTATNGNEFVHAGLGPPTTADVPLPADLLPELLGRTNLVCYDWEITGLRCEQWLYMGQYFRFVSKMPQLPFESASLAWLKAIEPKLGNSLTEITRTGSSQLSLVRQSGIGLTGIELHLLADWLESPRFPIGLNTLLAPPPDALEQPPAAATPPPAK